MRLCEHTTVVFRDLQSRSRSGLQGTAKRLVQPKEVVLASLRKHISSGRKGRSSETCSCASDVRTVRVQRIRVNGREVETAMPAAKLGGDGVDLQAGERWGEPG